LVAIKLIAIFRYFNTHVTQNMLKTMAIR